MSGLRQAIKRRMDHVPSERASSGTRAGLAVLAAVSLMLIAAVTGGVPFLGGSDGGIVRAEVSSANQVNDRTPVRVGGVEVGTVESVSAGNTPGTATLNMRITDDDLVLHRDARAEVRWRTVLGGNMYVDLQPGSASAPLLGSATIPLSRTGAQVELDDLTQIFDGDTAGAQRRVLRELRRGFSDPASTARTIDTLPALRTVGHGLAGLRGQEGDDLRRLVAAGSQTFEGLGEDPVRLQRLVDAAADTLAVTAARKQDLRALIRLAPGSLDSTLVTMRRLRTTLSHLDPLVVGLRAGASGIAPAVRAANPALHEARTLLEVAQPLLRAAGPTLDSLRTLSRTGVPLLRELDPTVRRLDAELLPFLERRDPQTRLRNYEAIGPWFAAVGSAGSQFNDAGHIVQFPILPGPNSALSANAPTIGGRR